MHLNDILFDAKLHNKQQIATITPAPGPLNSYDGRFALKLRGRAATEHKYDPSSRLMWGGVMLCHMSEQIKRPLAPNSRPGCGLFAQQYHVNATMKVSSVFGICPS